MLQRIQTVYLLLVAIGTIIMYFLPFGMIFSEEQVYTLGSTGIKEAFGEKTLVYPVWGFAGLLTLIVLLSLITIFLFRTRMRQIRLCIFNTCLLVGFYAFFVFFFFFVVRERYPEAVLNLKFALALPFVSIVLNCLAIRNIGADEALIRSLNRLR